MTVDFKMVIIFFIRGSVSTFKAVMLHTPETEKSETLSALSSCESLKSSSYLFATYFYMKFVY